MALKIKKTVLDNQGRVVEELEGTESEIESYMKKRQKRDETLQKEQSKKKGILLGKEMLAKIQEMIDAAILKHAVVNHLNLRTVEHHWYHSNGWWYQPQWNNGSYTYCATNKDPNVYGTAGSITCSSAAELSAQTGINANEIGTSPIVSYGNGQANGQTWTGNAISSGKITVGQPASSGLTSGIINMNIKS